MKKMRILLNTSDKIKKFINLVYQLDYELILKSGKDVFDGESIMGLFNLDLTKPIEVNVKYEFNSCFILKELEPFLI